jgi:hypothetical protein
MESERGAAATTACEVKVSAAAAASLAADTVSPAVESKATDGEAEVSATTGAGAAGAAAATGRASPPAPAEDATLRTTNPGQLSLMMQWCRLSRLYADGLAEGELVVSQDASCRVSLIYLLR